MLCPKCGQTLPEESTFCGLCGAQLSLQETPEVMQSETPAAAPAESTAYTENTAFAQADFSAEPVKKKKFKPILISVIAAVLVVAIVFGVMFFFKKKDDTTPASNSKVSSVSLYNALAKYGNTEGKINAFSELYGSLLETKNGAFKTDIGLNISDETLFLLEELIAASGVDFDLDWLKSVSFSVNTNVVDNSTQSLITLNVGGEKLISADVIFSYDDKTLYIGVPELSSTYLTVSMDIFDTLGALETFNEFVEDNEDIDILEKEPDALSVQTIIISVLSDPEFQTLLPTEDEMYEFLMRYADVIEKSLKNDSSESYTLQVGDVSQNVTKYTMDVTEQDLADVSLAVLETLKTDPTILGFIDELSTYLDTNFSTSLDGVKEEYIAGLDDAISEMNETEMSDEVYLSYIRYVDSEDYIVGRELKLYGEETAIYHATAQNAGEYESVFKTITSLEGSATYFTITGKGTIENRAKTGNYTIIIDQPTSTSENEKEAIKLEKINYRLRDFVIDERGVNGSFILDMPESVTEELESSELASMFSGSAAIELKFTTNEDSFRMDLNLLFGNTTFFGIFYDMSETTVTGFSIPTKSMPVEDASKWIETVDYAELIKLMGKSPIKEIIELMTTAISSESLI